MLLVASCRRVHTAASLGKAPSGWGFVAVGGVTGEASCRPPAGHCPLWARASWECGHSRGGPHGSAPHGIDAYVVSAGRHAVHLNTGGPLPSPGRCVGSGWGLTPPGLTHCARSQWKEGGECGRESAAHLLAVGWACYVGHAEEKVALGWEYSERLRVGPVC